MASLALFRGRGDEPVPVPPGGRMALRARNPRRRVGRVRELHSAGAGWPRSRGRTFPDAVPPGPRWRRVLRLPVEGRAVGVHRKPRGGRVGAVAGSTFPLRHRDVRRVPELPALAAGRGDRKDRDRQKDARNASGHGDARPRSGGCGYFAASRMISSITVSTSRAVFSRVGSLNIWSIVVGLIVSSTTSFPSA